ncbi:tetratricopeptide repeat protein [Patiriisocius sp. Uisw_017]|uniref:tetratricopeptide repeat protein n=1 Tax=Patiriisocius sp. Uisw_017 TaxID=3230968 RepID=UPI0039EC7DFB
MKKLLYLLLCCSTLLFGQNELLFEKGKENYKSENYTEAIANWTKIVKSEQQSSEVYFNLGNAHYKLNQIGPSIYYYEKALQVDPADTDTKINLAFAENARIDAIEPLPKTVFSKWYISLARLFTYEGWAYLVVVFSMLFVLLFLLYYFGNSESKKRFYFSSAIVSVLLFLGVFIMAYSTFNDFKNDKPAIIFAISTQIKTAPKMSSDDAFVLHEGTKVQILDSDGDWLRIVLSDGKDGWIPKTDLKIL